MSAKLHFVIGSTSKYRRATLEQHLGDKYELSTAAPDIDEKAIRHEDPATLPLLIARAKLDAVVSQLTAEGKMDKVDFVFCGDQIADFKGEIREKPESPEQNRVWFREYCNNEINTYAGTVLLDVASGKIVEKVNKTTTRFNEISEAAMDGIIKTGDSLICCGGFVVEDPHLKPCIKECLPSSEAVQGIDINVVKELLKELGQVV